MNGTSRTYIQPRQVGQSDAPFRSTGLTEKQPLLLYLEKRPTRLPCFVAGSQTMAGKPGSQPEANSDLFWLTTRDGSGQTSIFSGTGWLPGFPAHTGRTLRKQVMNNVQEITPAKRKRLLKAFGNCPAGYTHDDLERSLDLLYGLFSHVYTQAELRQMVVSDPFDRSESPRQLKLVELADWLEALVA